MTANRTPARPTARLVAGLSLAADASRLYGCIVSAEGRGFRTRPRVIAVSEEETPPHAVRIVQGAVNGDALDAGTALALGNELADLQARILQKLLVQLPEDDPVVLTAALADFGWHQPEQPGEHHAPLLSFFEPVRLAELSGITVVDDFLRRDVAAGGDGRGVLLAPLWLLLADRSTRKEERHARLLIHRGTVQTVIYYFPPHAVQGDALPPMAFLPVSHDPAGAEAVAGVCRAVASRCVGETPHWPRVQRVEIAGDTEEDPWLDALQDALPGIEVRPLALRGAPDAFPARYLNAAAAAILSVLHIDQAPANLPENAGDATPRVLGRLTPGSPVHWRRLLRMMAQHELPATTLNRAM